MNLDLEARLEEEGIRWEYLPKSQKVRLLTMWSRAYPELMASARRQENSETVSRGSEAEEDYRELPPCDFYILPDDQSGMPSYACFSARPPDLTDLVSDMFTKCDELVVVEADFRWSSVYVNHGPSAPARHFSAKAG